VNDVSGVCAWTSMAVEDHLRTICEVHLELQARGFQAEDVSTLGINKLILLLKEHCQGLRVDVNLISLVVPEASEPLPDQQVDGDNNVVAWWLVARLRRMNDD
jgi:hypothetical protein